MTYQEAEKLIEEIDNALKIAVIKSVVFVLFIAITLCLLSPFIEKIWEDFQYWIDCKKWDRENKKKSKTIHQSQIE